MCWTLQWGSGFGGLEVYALQGWDWGLMDLGLVNFDGFGLWSMCFRASLALEVMGSMS